MTMRAYTLLETVVVIGITTVVFVALAYFFLNFNTLYQATENSGGVSDAGAETLAQMHADILSADQILATHTFTEGTFASGTTTLVLELPTVDSAGNVAVGTHDYVVFFLSGTNLYRTLDTGSGSARTPGTKLLVGSVEALSFSYNNASSSLANEVDVYATTTSSSQRGTITQYRHLEAYLRNF